MADNSAAAALPKSGHVGEVCKEWLVREDGALAYKLQSEEITDFYKGNKYRNAVVRHDFPTALEEQIKEKEQAEKQSMQYRQFLSEQEEHDKRVAKEIAENLEQDLQEQRQRELDENEQMAKELQDIYVNLPPPQRRPPRPEKASISRDFQNSSQFHPNCTDIASAKPPNKLLNSMQGETRSINHNNNFPINKTISLDNGNIRDFPDSVDSALRFIGSNPIQSAQRNGKSIQYDDVADSIRKYDIKLDEEESASPIHQHHQSQSAAQSSSHSSSKNNFNKSPSSVNENLFRADYKLQKLSPEKFDYLMGNNSLGALNIRKDYRQVDNIEVDTNEIVNLEEFGLPLEEIKEISLKIAQEKKDEALARQLQEMEKKDGLSQEEKDRLLAIEAQDKELAKMLQEREKSKAKRAKEKARLKKSQQHRGHNESAPTAQPYQSPNSQPEEASFVQKEDNQIDLDPYSNPIDLITQQQQLLHGNHLERSPASHAAYKDDDIYTLPVDSCKNSNRPSSLNFTPESLNLSMTRSEKYPLDNHDPLNNDISPRMHLPKSSSYDHSSSPTPPYMPIQGTRRSNSSDERKKKSKDKCTHQ